MISLATIDGRPENPQLDTTEEEQDGEIRSKAGEHEEEDEDENAASDDESEDDEDTGVPETVREDLERVLTDDDGFKGSFSFHRAYPDAPDPRLQLADLGLVNLPLSAADAETVKSRCTQAPFGKGEQTLVDKNVRDTWEMDAKLVNFGNPSWDTFLSQVVKEVCEVLGVNFAASLPRCELYKLLLYERGSHFLPHVDTEKQNGMFATIVVVLPSQFSGGAVHLSHGALSTVYDCSSDSTYETNVFAWYTDVMHEIKPIISGHRLALSFNLIHTTQALRPALSTNTGIVVALRRILKAWVRDEGQCTPDKLVYLREHTYSQASLRASALKGADAHKAAMLDSLSSRLGFRLGLASVEYHRWGSANAYDSEHSYDGFSAAVESKMSITHFVDLEGRMISYTLPIDEENNTIPSNLAQTLEDGPADKEKYAGYQGNWGGDLSWWYRRTVLVIWPDWSDYTVIYAGPDGTNKAIKEIKSFTAAQETVGNFELIELVLSRANQFPVAAAEAVEHVAYQWNNPNLWVRATKSCSIANGLAIFPDNTTIFKAIDEFGFESIKEGIEAMLDNDPHNVSRMDFLKDLEQWALSLSDEILQKATIRQWVTEQVFRVSTTLKTPVRNEQGLLLSLAMVHGGIDYLRNQILRQVFKFSDDEFFYSFATAVHAETAFDDSDTKSAVVSDLFAAAINKVSFSKSITHPPHTLSPPPPYGDASSTATDCFASPQLYMEKAQELGCLHLIDAIVRRVADTTRLDKTQAAMYAREIMAPFITLVAESVEATGKALPPGFKDLQQAAIESLFNRASDEYYWCVKDDAIALVNIAFAGNGGEIFMKKVWPRIKSVRWSMDGLESLVIQLIEKSDKIVAPGTSSVLQVRAMAVKLLKHHIANCPLDRPGNLMVALNLCTKLEVLELSNDIFASFDISSRYLVGEVLIPLLPQLRQWASQNNRNVDSFVRKNFATWATNVLEGPPTISTALANHVSALAKWTCSCQFCADARHFLVKDDSTLTTLYCDGADSNDHIEDVLGLYARDLSMWSFHYRETPLFLSISKPKELCELVQWRTNYTKGMVMFESLSSDESERRDILGPEYDRVKSTLESPESRSLLALLL